MFVGQADNALPWKTRQTVLGSLNTSRGSTSNYTQRYKDLMGVSPGTTKSVFNPADIKESGIINFVSRNENGRMVHTAYIQKTSDNRLFIYSTNQAELDLAMYRATGRIETSAGALVSNLDNDGLQSFLNNGYDFVFTPNSTLNANAGLAA